jgi:hypothetical protein
LEKKTSHQQLLTLRTELPEIGKDRKIWVLDQYVNAGKLIPGQASMEIAQALNDKQLQEAFKKYPARDYTSFRGRYYTYEDGNLTIKGVVDKIHTGIAETEKKYGQAADALLKLMAQAGGHFGAQSRKELQTGMLMLKGFGDSGTIKIVVPSFW